MIALLTLWKALGRAIRGSGYLSVPTYFWVGRDPDVRETLTLSADATVLSRVQDIRNILNGLDKRSLYDTFLSTESAIVVLVYEFRRRLRDQDSAEYQKFQAVLHHM